MKYVHETPKNIQQASLNDVKCFERILAKMLSLKNVIWPYLPKLLIDDFGIVIGADQVSTNLKIVKQLTLPNIKPLQVKIIPIGTR